MATVGQIYFNVLDTTQETPTLISNISEAIFYGGNMVTNYSNARSFSKIGIQAPPGTQVKLGETDSGDDDKVKTIMIGRTGMYELDDKISIKFMKFVQQKNYTIDDEATERQITAGVQGMKDAKEARDENLEAFELRWPDGEPPVSDIDDYKAYWNDYTANVQQPYIAAYSTAYNIYQKGVNGIYKLDPNEPNKQLQNVIVDFIYE